MHPFSTPWWYFQVVEKRCIGNEWANISFATGVFPEKLKAAKVIPIHKKDSKLECSNYRPISLLTNIDKY